MRSYFLGDIHGNLYALEACLHHIDMRSADVIYCLGDIVGWLPFGDRTLKRMWKTGIPTVAGNHDLMVAGKFCDYPDKIDRMQASAYNSGLLSTIPGAWQYLADLPLIWESMDFVVVHHSPFDLPQNDEEPTIDAFNYLDEAALAKCLEAWNAYDKRIIFSGHDHVPAIFELPPNLERPQLQDVTVYRPQGNKDLSVRLRSDFKYWVKAGSVGGPYRDTVAAANIVCYDDEQQTITLERIPYPTEKLANELAAHPYCRNLVTIQKIIRLLKEKG